MAIEGGQLGSGILDLSTLQSYVHITADRANLRVKFVPGLKGPCTTKDEIQLPTPNANITENDITLLRHAVLHEVGHHTKGKDMFPILKETKLQMDSSPLGSLLNAFEDCRIERELAKDYAGDKEILTEGRSISYRKGYYKNMKHIKPDDKDGTTIATALNLIAETDSVWNSADLLEKSSLLEHTPPHVKTLLDKCEKAGITEDLKHTKTARDVLDIAKKVYELIYEKSADDHIKEQQAKAKAGEGEGNGEGEGQQEDGEGEGDKEPGKGEGKKPGMKEAWAKYTPASPDHGPTKGAGLHLDYTGHDASKYETFQPCTAEETSVFDLRTNKDIGKAKTPPINVAHTQRWVSDYKNEANVKTLANKIRRFLQVKSQAYYIGNQVKGKVHQKNLYRVGCPHVGDGSWNSRVFKKKEQNDILDVSVSVLVDYSGSMGGQKIKDAIKASMILTECLSHGLRVPVEVVGFTENGCKLNMLLIKQFDDRAAMEVVGNRMVPGTDMMCQNNDGDAVLFAYNRLRKRKEKRKMLFVLSDGSPASSRRGDAYTYTKNVVRSIETQGIVDVYGIGIQDKNVEKIYKKNEVLKDSHELESKLLKIVQRRIINEEVK